MVSSFKSIRRSLLLKSGRESFAPPGIARMQVLRKNKGTPNDTPFLPVLKACKGENDLEPNMMEPGSGSWASSLPPSSDEWEASAHSTTCNAVVEASSSCRAPHGKH